jgi:hypothetical protein
MCTEDDAKRIQGELLRWWLSNGQPSDAVLVHGACDGADKIAAGIWSGRYRLPVDPHPANWRRYGSGAGFKRNQEMVDSGIDYCLAFFKEGARNRGTTDCAWKARMAGVTVKEVWLK